MKRRLFWAALGGLALLAALVVGWRVSLKNPPPVPAIVKPAPQAGERIPGCVVLEGPLVIDDDEEIEQKGGKDAR